MLQALEETNDKFGFDDPTDLEDSACGRTWLPAISVFLGHKEASNVAPKTMAFYECQANNLAKRAVAKGIKFSEFRATHLRADGKERAAAGIKINTVRHANVVAKELFRYARRQRLIKTDPLSDYIVGKPEKPVKFVPTDADLGRLLETVRDEYKPSRNPDARYAPPKLNQFRCQRMVSVICVAADTAARIHEILALRVQDVRFEHRDIQFRKVKNQKPYVHTVPLSDDLAEILQVWLRVRPKNLESDLLFPNESNGGPCAPESFSKLFRKHTVKTGLVGMTFHSLRHYSISTIAHTDRVAAQSIAGHSNPATTDIYIHESASHLRDAHERASPLGNILRNRRSQAQVTANRRRAKIV